jgi:hypothetical protein
MEAAYEAPNVYSAIDALAARARAAAERRQRLLLEAADALAQVCMRLFPCLAYVMTKYVMTKYARKGGRGGLRLQRAPRTGSLGLIGRLGKVGGWRFGGPPSVQY